MTTETVIFQHFRIAQRADGSLHELGRGAMGVTYKAQDTELGGFVALKVINAMHLDSDVARERFLREARAAAYLHHPNVASVFHLGREANAFFYAMEFVEGETLEDCVHRRGPLPVRLALRIALQAALGLGAANERGLVHRDIKPANLMLAQSGGASIDGDARLDDDDEDLLIKVIDFGLAKSLHRDTDGSVGLSLTGGGPIGTPYYMSPEQIEPTGFDIDARSDIYSLGITLWHLITGKPPFQGSQFQVLSQHLNQPPPLEQLEKAGMAPGVVALLGRMLAKQPADRPANHRELAGAIKQLLRELPSKSAFDPSAMQMASLAPMVASASSQNLATGAAPLLVEQELPGAVPIASARRRRKQKWKLTVLVALIFLAQAGAVTWLYTEVIVPAQQRQQDMEQRNRLLQEEAEQEHALQAPNRAKSAKVLLVPKDFSSIQVAIDAANPGDTVQVAPGEYRELIRFKEGINLMGDGMDQVTVRTNAAAGSVLSVEKCRFGVISGMTFEQIPGHETEASLPAVIIKSSGVRMAHCKVVNSAAYGIYIRGQDHSLIEDCEVSGSARDGIHVMDPGAVPTIKNNHVSNSRWDGILLHLGAAGLVQGNITEHNDGSGIALVGAGVAPKLQGNQCRDNQKWGIFVEKGSSPTITADNQYQGNMLGDIHRQQNKAE